MSAVDALSASAATSSASGINNAFSAMDSSEFVKIIFTELANQDPLAPSDSQALLEQISTIRSIQSSIDMSARLESLVGQNEWTSAAGLIGKKVSGLSEDLLRVDGVVKSVSRTESGAVLNLESGTRVPVSWVDEILTPPSVVTP
jgi:flagellar basal-body rod modification protein FlgD